MNGNSFVELEKLEQMPLGKWFQLLNIHNRRVQRENAALEKK